MDTSLFDYNLPESLIAQNPSNVRENSRMLVVDKVSGACEIRNFYDIESYLHPKDCMVLNNTKVINARMFGMKNNENGYGAKIEILLMNKISSTQWQCMLKPGKRVKKGVKVTLLNIQNKLEPTFYIHIINHNNDGSFIIEFSVDNILQYQNNLGHIPLPPYIKRSDNFNDKQRYQTVYAKNPGAVAAPTAGLHFSEDILANLAKKGVNIAEVTLHVGAGTFKPVDVDNIENHKMHTEKFDLSQKTTDMINNTHKNNNRVLAIGTTTVRVLESCSNDNNMLESQNGDTDIFIYPPYNPKIADMLLTNFHLPKSTLLMLVSTFASREIILNAYEIAIKENFRFYSYGDCMLIK